MDKSLILSVAGSGKTTYLVNQLSSDSKVVIVTYTIANAHNIRAKIIEKFSFIPDTIAVYTYFGFLYSFCFKPFLYNRVKPKGIFWNFPPEHTLHMNRKEKYFYITKSNYLYHNRIAKLIDECKVLDDVKNRISKYYDSFYIDEIQDFGGHDFNFLISLLSIDMDIKLVGDFYQHTFDTSNDGRVNCNIYNDYASYLRKFVNAGVKVDDTTLSRSYRCSPVICEFISENIGINILSHREDRTEVNLVTDKDKAVKLFYDNSIVKLFFKESNKYDCFSKNWGASKGEDKYADTCIVLNKNTYDYFLKDKLKNLAPSTKNKLYVALSRTRGNCYLVPDSIFKN